MYDPILITAPTAKPVSVAEAKAHLRVDVSDEDTYIGTLIDAASAHLDGWTGQLGQAICEQTWRDQWDDFSSVMRLNLYPVQSVSSVKYIDTNGDEQTIDAANYYLMKLDGTWFVVFKFNYTFPALSVMDRPAVTIEYVAGYDTVPAAICHAIKLIVGAWYENREETIIGVPVARLPDSVAVNALLAPYRRVGF